MTRFDLDFGDFDPAVYRKLPRNPMGIFLNLPPFLWTNCIFLACHPSMKFATEVENMIPNKKSRRPSVFHDRFFEYWRIFVHNPNPKLEDSGIRSIYTRRVYTPRRLSVYRRVKQPCATELIQNTKKY
jgi:hypothetical protein